MYNNFLNYSFAYFHNYSLSRSIRRNGLGSQLFFCVSIANCHVLTGHPEHELLFVATQVARAAGLKNASHATWKITSGMPTQAVQIGSLPKTETLKNPANVQKTSWLTSEEAVYQMLLRGHAPASEPFRKWVTEEVLPTIRKTGRYDAEASTDPIAQSLMDELKTLRGDVAELKALLVGMNLTAPLHSIAPPSPYIGTEATTVPFHYQKALGRELMDLAGLNTPAADKATPRVVVALEEIVKKLWDEEDGRHLESAMGDCPITVPTDPAGRCFKGITALSTSCCLWLLR